jgi:sterol 14alpha-demethylase
LPDQINRTSASATVSAGSGRGWRRSYGRPRRWKKGVATTPGTKTVTSTPVSRNSNRRLSAKPDRYHPDRFVADPTSQQDLVDFGGGLHRCLGMHFSYVEMKLTIARLLQHLELDLLDTNPRPAPGQKTKWPQSPCRVGYRKKAAVGAARSPLAAA